MDLPLRVVFLVAGMVGLAARALASLASPGDRDRSVAWHTRLQTTWARCPFALTQRLFGLRRWRVSAADVPVARIAARDRELRGGPS